MTQRPISPAEIDQLARRLEQITGDLDDRERALLQTVVELAREALAPDQSEDGRGSPWDVDRAGAERATDEPGLIAGFANAFQPGGPAVFAVEAIPPPAGQERKQTFKVRLI